jgi:hypothetical protein
MSNVNQPFGFRPIGTQDGIAPNFGLARGQMLSSASAAFYGDLLTITGGYLSPAAVVGGGAPLAGVAKDFDWASQSQQRHWWNQYWPGNDTYAGQYVVVHYSMNPQAKYQVQALNNSGNGAVTQASVGKFANFSAGAGGNTANGISSHALDDSTISAVQGNLPLKIVGIVQSPASDPTSAYNLVIVELVNLAAG